MFLVGTYMENLAKLLRSMADRERARSDDTPEARAYYEGVSDGLIMAAEAAEAQAEPLKQRLTP